MGENGYVSRCLIKNLAITPEILKFIAEIDEFKERWKAIETLAPEKLNRLQRTATVESVVGHPHRRRQAQRSGIEHRNCWMPIWHSIWSFAGYRKTNTC